MGGRQRQRASTAPVDAAGGHRARVRATPLIGRPPWLLPLLLVLLGVLVDLMTPADLAVGGPFAAAPLVAAALWTARGTLLTGLASLTVFGLLQVGHGGLPLYEVLVRESTVGVVALLAAVMSHALSHSDRSLASAREIAEALQLAVLPTPPPRIGPLAIAARYEAAQADARIGGDLYAVQRTPHGVRLLVGDVRGKGVGAVRTVTVLLGAFREAAEQEADLASVADRLEHALYREGEQRRESAGVEPAGPAEDFATAVVAEVPAGAPDRLRIVNRAHPPPLLLHPEGAVHPLEPAEHALPLGLGRLAPSGAPPARSARFPPGAMLLLHTDGVTEARNEQGAFYDVAARLRGRRFGEPAELLQAVLADVAAYTGGRTFDDAALLAVARDRRQHR